MSRFIVRHPRLIIAAVVVVTLLFAFSLRRGIELDVSPLGFVENTSQVRADFENARNNFGSDDYLVVALVCDDVFAPANLARLGALHVRIEKLKGVSEVLSLANVPYARSEDGVVAAGKLIPHFDADEFGNGYAGGRKGRGSASAMSLDEIRRVATTDRLFVGNLVSADSKTAAINILFRPEVPTAARHVITGQIYDAATTAGFEAVYFAGDPFSQWRSTQAVKSDLSLFLPLTLILIALLLWLCFRSFAAVALPLATIGIGLVWLFGLMACFESHFTILALMLPTLMLAIGCSYIIHVVNQIGIVKERRMGMDKGDILVEAMGFINLPVFVSALTIIAGFLSLSFAGIPAIRSTGIYAAIGAAITMVLSLTFIPAVLMLLGERAFKVKAGLNGSMVKLLEDTGRWATSRQKLLYILTGILVVISIAGMFLIKIDIDFFHFFKPNAETSVGLAEVNRRLSGAVTFEIIVEGKETGAIENPGTLGRIAEFQTFAESLRDRSGQGIDRTLSVVDFTRHINRAFNDNSQQHYSIPADSGIVRELLSDKDHLRGFLSPDGRTARILVRSNLSRSQAMAGVISQLEKRGRELLPEFRVVATGTFVLLNRTSDQIGGEQIQSVSIALVTIFLMLSVLFKSLRVGLTALIPNLIPILFFFGFMGWRGIYLNLTTSLVASVVLGLAVDNAVQFIVRFRRVQAHSEDLREAIIESMRLSGRPIIYANIALASTFAIFTFSNFAPIASFGLLSAVTIIGCLIEDLVLLPARLTSPVFRAK
jgi:hypothetical protein